MKYSASLACATQLRLGEDIDSLVAGEINIFHIDLMDGTNVPNLCMNFDQMREIKEAYPTCVLDVHMMMVKPERYLERVKKAGGDIVVANHKTLSDVNGFIQLSKKLGLMCGLVVNPEDNLRDVEEYLPFLEYVLIMSIIPGEYGQKFKEETYNKIAEFKKYRDENGCSYLISVDGGVDAERGILSKKSGADMLVLGVFAVFRQECGIKKACERFKQEVEK